MHALSRTGRAWDLLRGLGTLIVLLCPYQSHAQSMNGVRPGSGASFSGSLAGTFTGGGSFSGRLSSTPLAGRPSIAALARPINGVSIGGLNSASSYAGISASNPFAAYYANPLAAGVAGSIGTTSATFGVPIYNVNAIYSLNADPSGNSLTGAAGPISTNPRPQGFQRMTNGETASGLGYPSSYAVGPLPTAPPRAAYPFAYGGEPALIYVPGKGFDQFPPLPQLRQRTDLQQVLIRSASLPSRNNMIVLTDGTSIILRGTAGNLRERQLAEALLRLSPGVGRVRNELDVFPPNRGPEGPRGPGY
jgi:hypothetical protein